MIAVKLLHWILFFLFLLGFSFGLLLLRQGLAQLKGRVEKMKVKVAFVEEAAREGAIFETRLTEKKEELEALKKKTLKPGEQEKFISLITQITETLKISIIRMKPVTPEGPPASPEEKKFIPTPFELEMECPYRALGGFFEKLREAGLISRVEGFSVEPKGPTPSLHKIQMTLVVYEERL